MNYILLFLVAFISAQATVTYNGFKVLRINFNASNYEQLNNIVESKNLDVWARNAKQLWMDVMVSPNEDLTLLQEFNPSVSVPNVQDLIDQEQKPHLALQPDPFFNSFPTTAQVLTWLDNKISAYPELISKVVVGKTYQGRDIVGVVLSKGNTQKKAAFIQCTIHAREWITTPSCCWAIDQLLSGDQSLLEKFEWHFVPILNVDGYEHTRTDRLWRKNRQPNTGSTCIGTDLNRNYVFQWGGGGSSAQPCSETFRGASAGSAPEIVASTDYIRRLHSSNGLAFFFDIHAYGGMWMSPWGYTNALPPNYPPLLAIMEKAAAAVYDVNYNTYAYGTIANVIYVASGSSADWVLGQLGVIHAFALEVTGGNFVVPAAQIVPLAREIWAGLESTAQSIPA